MSPAELCCALAEGQEPQVKEAAVSRVRDLQAYLQAFRGSLDVRVDPGAPLPVVTAWTEDAMTE